MQTGMKKRTVGWLVAGLALAAVVGVSVVLLAGNYKLGQAAFGRSDDKSTPRNPESPGGAPSVRVKTIRPSREHLQRTTTQTAHVEPYEKADVFAKVPGYLRKVHVDIGDRVKKDQVLAELWVPEMDQDRVQKQALVARFKADVGQADAAQKVAEAMVIAAKAKVQEVASLVAKYEADVTYRKGEHARYLQLFNDRAVQKDVMDRELNQLRAAEVSLIAAQATVTTTEANGKVEQAKLFQALADVTSAKSRLEVAQADLEHTIILLGYAKVTAPYDGVITRRLVHPGAFIQSAATSKTDPLFTIVGVDRVRIVTDISESDSAWIKVGQPATLLVDASRGQRFSGRVARLADALDRKSRTMLVEVELEKPTSHLRPGMYGSVAIILADYPDALLLPTSALLAEGGKPAVMMVKDGKAQRQEVDLGYNDGVRIQINRGFNGDEQIITDGKNTVREGQAVEIAK